MSYHYLLKYIIVGDSAVGKSCLLLRFTDDRFQQCYDVTIGVEFGTKIISMLDHRVKLQIWDTAGQENFKSITRSYYRGSAGCLLVYDITKKETFENCKDWLEDARTYAADTLVVMLIGNKSDLKNLRQVSTDEARQFAEDNDLLFIETSAKTGQNVQDAFHKTAKEIYGKIQTNDIVAEFATDELGSGVKIGSLFDSQPDDNDDGRIKKLEDSSEIRVRSDLDFDDQEGSMDKGIEKEENLAEETRELIEKEKYFYEQSKFQFQYVLESYYTQIKDFTIPSVFIPLTHENGKELGRCCHSFYESKKLEFFEPLVKEIDDVLKNNEVFKGENTGAFVKLSTRSPKDVYFDKPNEKLEKYLIEELKNSDKSENGDAIAFSLAYRRCYRIRTGREAFLMLIQSERIREEMVKFLQFPDAFKMNIVLRKFENLHPRNEFRGFVFKKKLTSLSQYCYLEYFEELKKNKEEIGKRIREFYETSIKEVIPHDDYIIDFGILEENGKIVVIELNPFFNRTGACLFNWNVDQKVIRGEEEFQFRIVEEPYKNALKISVSEYWRKAIAKERKGGCSLM